MKVSTIGKRVCMTSVAHSIEQVKKKIGQAKIDNKVDNFGSGKVEKFLSAVDSLTKQDSFNYYRKSKMKKAGVSVKFLMVGETNSMVGYHLMTESHSIQLRSGGAMSPPPAG